MQLKHLKTFVTLLFFLGFFQLGAQVIADSSIIKKADKFMQKEKYEKAFDLYEEEAIRYKSPELLHKAALCYEQIKQDSYCNYFKNALNKGFPMKKEELFFYGCDPKTFREIKKKQD